MSEECWLCQRNRQEVNKLILNEMPPRMRDHVLSQLQGRDKKDFLSLKLVCPVCRYIIGLIDLEERIVGMTGKLQIGTTEEGT